MTSVQSNYDARQLIDALPVAAVLLDRELTIEYSNQTYRDLWGLEGAWLAQRPGYRAVLEWLRDRRRLPEQLDFRIYLDTQLSKLRTLKGAAEDTLFLPSGKILQQVAAPVTDGVLLSFQDISDALSATRTLNQARSVHHSLLDQLEEGLAVIGADGKLQYHNPAFRSLWRLEADFLTTQPPLSQFLDATRAILPVEPNWPVIRDRLAGRLLGRSAGRKRIFFNDGRAVDAAHLPLPDGGSVLVYRDSTTEHTAETALREKAAVAVAESRLKSHFMAMLSHELRTPLTTLIGFAELLSGNTFGNLNAKQSDYATGIETTGRRMLTLLTDVLDLSSLEAGQDSLAIDSFALHPFFVDLLAAYDLPAQGKKVSLVLECSPDIGWLSADNARLARALGHLLTNALEFTGPGGTIALSATKEAGECVIAVTDTGVGLPKEEVDRLNLPGTKSLSETSAFSGQGLGLTIVKELLAHQGGAFSLTSRPNRGTTVTCRLPSA